ncbi:MAG: GlxA family transcriptional regulator [Pseudomonadota bacterium]
MNQARGPGEPRRVGFLLIEDFPLIALAGALDALRGANQMAQDRVYDWHVMSPDGAPVLSSAETAFPVDGRPAEAPPLNDLLVIAGLGAHRFTDRAVLDWLRRLSRQGCRIGGVSSGTFLLARAGLLEGKAFVLHWDLLPLFQEEFPALNPKLEVFSIDGTCLTCAGGTAALDLMLWLIAADYGWELSLEVAEQFIYPRIREGHRRQRQTPPERYGVNNQTLVKAIGFMERNLADGLSVIQVAQRCGVSQRQLERLFKKYMSCTPSQFYGDLRLRRARYLLFYTTVPILEVAATCGFGSHSYFSKAYRAHYGHTPSEEREARRLTPESLKQHDG